MSPTLIGGNIEGRCHYGISDNHEIAIRNLKRFDVVITYYPNSWNGGDEDTTYKIKRVWGFPGETISMSYVNEEYTFTVTDTNSEQLIYETKAKVDVKDFDGLGKLKVATFSDGRRTFNTNAFDRYYDAGEIKFNSPLRSNFTVTLDKEKGEYFLMGDNWTASSDSYTHLGQSSKITFGNIQGRVIAMQGTARVVNQELTDKKRIRNMYYF